jgi:hypothetical protein
MPLRIVLFVSLLLAAACGKREGDANSKSPEAQCCLPCLKPDKVNALNEKFRAKTASNDELWRLAYYYEMCGSPHPADARSELAAKPYLDELVRRGDRSAGYKLLPPASN